MVMMISDEKFPQFYKICHKHQDDSANMKKKGDKKNTCTTIEQQNKK